MTLHPYRRIAVLTLLALLLAVTFFVGIAVGITFAAPRPSSALPSASADQARTGAPLDPGVAQLAERDVRGSPLVGAAGSNPVSGANGGAPSPAAGPSEVRDLDATQPSDRTLTMGIPVVSVRGTLTGIASWHATGKDGMFAAAGPALRVGDWRGRSVEVCAARCVTVTLNDWCLCVVDGRERLLDLSDEAFAQLSPLSQGLVAVTVVP